MTKEELLYVKESICEKINGRIRELEEKKANTFDDGEIILINTQLISYNNSIADVLEFVCDELRKLILELL